MKTAELTGEMLDYWVARSDGGAGLAHWAKKQMFGHHYSPSTDWAQGGLIIERERINLEHDGFYALIDGDRDGITWRAEGKTILEAAMRCYVASKFGYEVPDA